MKRKRNLSKLLWIINIVVLFVICILKTSHDWANVTYGDLKFDEIIFYLTTPLEHTGKSILGNYFDYALYPSIIYTILFSFIIYFIYKIISNNNIRVNIKLLNKYNISFRILGIIIKTIINIIPVILLFVFIYDCDKDYDIRNFIKNNLVESKFIEDNYVEYDKNNIKFPSHKRNLIYIYVESLENEFMSSDVGGYGSRNLLPNLSSYALESDDSINFSNTDKLGGGYATYGGTYTSGAMVATTSGIPLKSFSGVINDAGMYSILDGATTLGDILHDNGYNQMIMFGSDKSFGNRGLYFTEHGNYKIYDYNTAIKKGKIDKDYYEWWGFEDSKLFRFAKEEIVKLSKKDKPFNFTMLTSNTHFPDGYLDKGCSKKYSSNYENVILCTDSQLYDFIEWVKEQDFYNNTTIIITGDHLSMDPYADNNNYNRTVYNLFINSPIKTKYNKNRLFTTIDMYPTTLASLGVSIKGNKLALGTNLYSNTKTLIEEYGYDYVYNEFQKRSSYYSKHLMSTK